MIDKRTALGRAISKDAHRVLNASEVLGLINAQDCHEIASLIFTSIKDYDASMSELSRMIEDLQRHYRQRQSTTPSPKG